MLIQFLVCFVKLHTVNLCTRLAWFLPPFPPPIIMGGLNLKVCQNFVGTKFFLRFVGGINLYGGRNMCYYNFIISFFRNSQHPEKWSVSVKNFFRKCECISSCYLPISSNLLKNSLRKTSLFVLFELLSMYDLLLPHNMNGLIISEFFCKNINEKVGKLV